MVRQLALVTGIHGIWGFGGLALLKALRDLEHDSTDLLGVDADAK